MSPSSRQRSDGTRMQDFIPTPKVDLGSESKPRDRLQGGCQANTAGMHDILRSTTLWKSSLNPGFVMTV